MGVRSGSVREPLGYVPGGAVSRGNLGGYLPVCQSAAFTGTRASNGDGILHILAVRCPAGAPSAWSSPIASRRSPSTQEARRQSSTREWA